MANHSLRDIERDLEQEKRRQDEEAFIQQQLEAYRSGRIQGAPPPIAGPRLDGSSHGRSSLGGSSYGESATSFSSSSSSSSSASSGLYARNSLVLKTLRFMLIVAVAYVFLAFYRAVKGIVSGGGELDIDPPIGRIERMATPPNIAQLNDSMNDSLTSSISTSTTESSTKNEGNLASGGGFDREPDISHALKNLDKEEIAAMKKEVDNLVDGNNNCVPKKRIILSVNKCGLGNRMVSLASTVMLGLLMDRVVELDWQSNRCFSTFFYLSESFEMPNFCFLSCCQQVLLCFVWGSFPREDTT